MKTRLQSKSPWLGKPPGVTRTIQARSAESVREPRRFGNSFPSLPPSWRHVIRRLDFLQTCRLGDWRHIRFANQHRVVSAAYMPAADGKVQTVAPIRTAPL